ncbi:hypothetical protein ACHAWF_016695 [Thalassiosira exigua]
MRSNIGRSSVGCRRSLRLAAQCKGTPHDENHIDCISQSPEQSSWRSASSKRPSKRTKRSNCQHSRAAQNHLKENCSTMPPLLDLGKLVRGSLVRRPSATTKSPYVADVSLFGESETKSVVLSHAPALDVGGMCVEGSEVYLSERKGEGITSHSIELVRGAPLGSPANKKSHGVLVGAHPRLGERIAEEILKRGLFEKVVQLPGGLLLGPTVDDDGSGSERIKMSKQVTLGDSRVDFQMILGDDNAERSSHRVVVEVKNVVCADYAEGTEPTKSGPGHCVIVAPPLSRNDERYERTALFPWGRTRGQTFEDEKVVSARACKHLRNLQSLLRDDDVTPVVLFIVNRSDCESVRACHEKCPIFAELLNEVVKAGVKAIGARVRWTEKGECYFDGFVPVVT